MDSGISAEVLLATFRHVGHGDAVTSHSSQGAATDRVPLRVDLEQSHRNPINSRLACVEISRARHDVQIYTSNLPQLSQWLGRGVSKSAVLSQNSAITIPYGRST